MKLILREDVENLGKGGDLVDVKPGYGRNYLLPRGLAVVAEAAASAAETATATSAVAGETATARRVDAGGASAAARSAASAPTRRPRSTTRTRAS